MLNPFAPTVVDAVEIRQGNSLLAGNGQHREASSGVILERVWAQSQIRHAPCEIAARPVLKPGQKPSPQGCHQDLQNMGSLGPFRPEHAE